MTEVINVGYNNQDIFLKSKYSSINSIMTSNISFYEKIDNLKKLYNWKNCNNNYEKFIVLKEIFKNTKSWITDRTDECYSKIDSEGGHDAFLMENEDYFGVMKSFINEVNNGI